ncbi:Uncharacterised protein [Chlamydia trachomatis]|nr:Uncharacterised protein [Chlamydia trachomatis]
MQIKSKKRILYSLKLYKLVYQVMECNKIKERGFFIELKKFGKFFFLSLSLCLC